MTGNVFLKTYFSKVIISPELQTKVRGFLNDTSKSYIEVLEDIHTNYYAYARGENIRGVPGGEMNSTITALTRHRAVTDQKSSKVEKNEHT